MDNHIHLISQMMPDNDPEAVQRDFLKYIAQRIKKYLEHNHPTLLAQFKVIAKTLDEADDAMRDYSAITSNSYPGYLITSPA